MTILTGFLGAGRLNPAVNFCQGFWDGFVYRCLVICYFEMIFLVGFWLIFGVDLGAWYFLNRNVLTSEDPRDQGVILHCKETCCTRRVCRCLWNMF